MTLFHAEIMNENEEMSVAMRKEELRLLARKGDVIPYVEFLMAFEHGEQFIWFEVAAIVSGFTHSDKQIKFASKKLAHWKKVKKGLLKSRIDDFLSDLKDEGIVADVKTQSSSNEKKRKVDSENPKGREQGREKASNATTPKVRRDGSPWIPQDQWMKLQKEKQLARENVKEVANASLQLVTDSPDVQNFNKSVEEYSSFVFKWDGGSAVHVVKDKSVLSNFDPEASVRSVAAYGGKVIKGAGEMKIRLIDGSVGILKNVFHDHSVTSNLLSTNQFTPFHHGVVGDKLVRFDTGAVIGYMRNGTPEVKVEVLRFDSEAKPTLPELPSLPTFAWTRSNQPVASGNVVRDDDEEVDVESGDDEFAQTTVTRTTTGPSQQRRPSALSLVWHSKLGHPGQKSFEEMKRKLGLKDVFHVPMSFCDTCLFGKTKHSIPKVSQNLNPATEPFQVLHADLCGPFHHPVGHDNSLYFIVIVDRFSRYVHAAPIRFKTDGSTVFKKFILESYTGFGSRSFPREVRSDNGGEFVNADFENFLEQRGIRNGLTNPYSSYQNGMAERRNQTLQEKARCLLVHAGVPLIFWPEAIRLAAALINWEPTRVLDGRTPMEVWHGEERKRPEPHTFGCLVHAVVPSELRLSSWESSTVRGAYLGPSLQRAGHRIVSFEPALVFDCSQVQFVEERFYFQEVDVDPVKLKYHNKVPQGLLPGIQRLKSLPKKSDKQAETDALRVKEFFGTLTELESELLKRRQPESRVDSPSHSTGSAVKSSDSTSPVVGDCSTVEI
ncbi:hypothetical protein OY671_007377, partial [Metschnikowia pulcherrima]